MKRWLANLTIAVYITALAWGITAQALKFGRSAHPAMYFLVWDMFCGWTPYEMRYHIIGEGISGAYYELDPPPWGEFEPFGRLGRGRRNYDVSGLHAGRFALNTLQNTEHEPIARMYLVEEFWAKKYNLPDHIWKQRFDEPKDLKKYYNVRLVLDGEGRVRRIYPGWMTQQNAYCLANNPRLQDEARRSKPMFELQLANRMGEFQTESFEFGDYFDPSQLPPAPMMTGNGN